ncbi:APL3 (YBL037W) [Zygosaccharomyces parabailii]|nr:APL3 (YBL037W) [Zygosaccharomyces parabailii]CDH17339.1 probable APL3-AP-2 complex subunit,alpha-adaptin,113 KD [Zygosaccharomyces bailii ISA1307]
MERRKTVINPVSNSSSSTIKGLQLFIADLRATQQSEEQEKRIQSELIKIQQHFEISSKKPNKGNDKLAGYQRKKYIAKLAYIYITSHTTKLNNIIFGLDQVVELLKSSVFSEKFLAYMTLELFYVHPLVVSKVTEQVAHQVCQDLAGNNDNNAALALNFVGVVGKLDVELARNEDVVSEVFQILRSPTSSHYLKKKAALAFLMLLKSNLHILTDDAQRKQSWIQRILSLLDDTHNYRLMLPVLPLVEYIAKYVDPTYCIRLLPQLTQILYNCIVVGTSPDGHFPSEFKFANVPNPWIITKIVSLLSVLIVSPIEAAVTSSQLVHSSNIDPETLGKLRKCVAKAIDLGTKQWNDPMEKIVLNSVLFSLINFASKLEPSQEAVSSSVTALCSLFTSGEINIRYLTLDSLVKLCSLSGKPAIDTVRLHNLDTIFRLLTSERDSSIVKKVVDLLYTFTDVNNVKTIVEKLFNHISASKHPVDPSIKSDIAVKIAILTEKYATDTNWFVVVSLRLLSMTTLSTLNDDEIWQRLCQIVVNNQQLQKLTCEQLLRYLNDSRSSEALVKTGAFLIGEYADLIIDKLSVGDLFNLFADKYFVVSNITRAMILTTMIKLYRIEPRIESVVIKFFQLELNSLDIELQIRSYEYLNIIQLCKLNGNIELLNALLAPMPPFNTKSNPLLKRLGSLPSSGGSATMVDLVGSSDNETDSNPNTPVTYSSGTRPPPPPPPSRPIKSVATGSRAELTGSSGSNGIPTGRDAGAEYYVQQKLTVNWEEGFVRMLSHRKGILYNSPLLRIIYNISQPQSEQPSQLRIMLTFVNHSEWEVTGISTEIIAARTQDNPEYVLQNVLPPSSTRIAPHKRAEQSFDVIVRRPFNVEMSPLVNVFFSCGGSTNLVTLKAAVGVTSTLLANISSASALSLPQFVSRWRTLSEALGKEGEYSIQGVNLTRRKPGGVFESGSNLATIAQTITRMGFGIADQASVPNTVFASGIVHTKSNGNFGTLVKVKYLDEASQLSITCKTTTPGALSQYVVECMEYALTN